MHSSHLLMHLAPQCYLPYSTASHYVSYHSIQSYTSPVYDQLYTGTSLLSKWPTHNNNPSNVADDNFEWYYFLKYFSWNMVNAWLDYNHRTAQNSQDSKSWTIIKCTPTGLWIRDDSKLAPSQWEMASLCKDVSHWLGASLESALWIYTPFAKW